jgi:hypothetical protein
MALAAIDDALQTISASTMTHRTSTLVKIGSHFVPFINPFHPAFK